MVAIIKQLGVGKIDRKQLQLDLGLSNIKTSDARLSRFKAKLAKAKGEGEGETSPAAPKTKGASPAKKRKVEDTEEVDDRFEDDKSMVAAVDTPTRKGSARMARLRSVKEELDEVDDEFQDSDDI